MISIMAVFRTRGVRDGGRGASQAVRVEDPGADQEADQEAREGEDHGADQGVGQGQGRGFAPRNLGMYQLLDG